MDKIKPTKNCGSIKRRLTPRCVSLKSQNAFHRRNASQWSIRSVDPRGQFVLTSAKPGANADMLLISPASSAIEAEAEETRVWLDLALRCQYISFAEASELDESSDRIFGQLVRMIEHPEK
jgi:hypothetical protein